MHVTHNKKKIYYAYLLQKYPVIEYTVGGAQLYESFKCENSFILYSREVEDGNRTIEL
jgi:hypothetical protein